MTKTVISGGVAVKEGAAATDRIKIETRTDPHRERG